MTATGNQACGPLGVGHPSIVKTPPRRRAASGIATLASALCLTLGACGSSPGGAAAPAAPRPASTAATPSPSPSAPPRPGQAVHLLNGEYKVTATVFSFRQPLRSQFPPRRGGYVFAGLDVRVCLDEGPGPSTVSWDPWSLTFPDATTIDPVSSWSDDWFSVPLFPGFEKTLRPGRCVRGWVLFEVPEGKHPSLAEYAPTDAGGERVTDGPSWEL